MNVMVVGGGGREHAIIEKLKENQKHRNHLRTCQATAASLPDAVCVDIGAKEIEKIAEFAVRKANRSGSCRAGRSAGHGCGGSAAGARHQNLRTG